jgi:hypothetical protein
MGSYLREFTGCTTPMVVYKYQHFIAMNMNMVKTNINLILPIFQIEICTPIYIIARRFTISTTTLYTEKYRNLTQKATSSHHNNAL